MPYSITREDPQRDLRALRAVLSGFPAGISSSAIPALQELADSIEEQVKPAIEEPTGDVLVRFDLVYKRQANGQWWPVDRVGSGYEWADLVAESQRQDIDITIYVNVAEVLRIGVGEAPNWDHDAKVPEEVRVGQHVRIRGHGLWRLISVNTEPGAIGVSKVDGRTARFCTLTANCRLADGHADGCRP